MNFTARVALFALAAIALVAPCNADSNAEVAPTPAPECSSGCPTLKPGCDATTYCKDGAYINVGFKPSVFDVDIVASE